MRKKALNEVKRAIRDTGITACHLPNEKSDQYYKIMKKYIFDKSTNEIDVDEAIAVYFSSAYCEAIASNFSSKELWIIVAESLAFVKGYSTPDRFTIVSEYIQHHSASYDPASLPIIVLSMLKEAEALDENARGAINPEAERTLVNYISGYEFGRRGEAEE